MRNAAMRNRTPPETCVERLHSTNSFAQCQDANVCVTKMVHARRREVCRNKNWKPSAGSWLHVVVQFLQTYVHQLVTCCNTHVAGDVFDCTPRGSSRSTLLSFQRRSGPVDVLVRTYHYLFSFFLHHVGWGLRVWAPVRKLFLESLVERLRW